MFDSVPLVTSGSPGVLLAEELREVLDTELLRLGADRLHERAVALQVQVGMLLGELARVTGALACARVAEPWIDSDRLEVEVGRELQVSAYEADTRLRFAKLTGGPLPDVAAALEAGEVTWGQASSITRELAELPVGEQGRQAVASLGARLLASARDGAGPGMLRREGQRAVEALTQPAAPWKPATSAERSLKLWRPRVTGGPPGGYLSFYGQLPWEDGALFAGVLDDLAGAYHREDGRRIEERRADALVEILRRAADAAPPISGSRAAVQLVVSKDTLLGRSEAPGELNGVPVPAGTARKHACDGGWFTRLVTEPETGRLLDYGRTRRDPTDRLRGYLIARDQHCQFPDCARRAARCVIHHATFWSRGGATDRVNCVAICPLHHSYVHERGWELVRHADETSTWLSPTGVRYHVTPPAVLAGELPTLATPLPALVDDRPRYRLKDEVDLLEWLTDPPEPPDEGPPPEPYISTARSPARTAPG